MLHLLHPTAVWINRGKLYLHKGDILLFYTHFFHWCLIIFVHMVSVKKSDKRETNPNPWNRANFLSKIFFWSEIPLILKGSKGNLKFEDIYDCSDEDSSASIGYAVQKEWDKELKKMKLGKKPNLTQAIIRIFGRLCCYIGILVVVIFCFIQMAQAMILHDMIKHFAQTSRTDNLYAIAAALSLLGIIETTLLQNYFFRMLRLSMRIKIACSLLVYKKALKLSQLALNSTSIGQIVNLLSNDASKLDEMCVLLPFLIVAPMQLVIIAYGLWIHIGYAGLASVSVLLVYLPIQVLMGKVFASLRMNKSLLSDERINLMNEIIDGIRGIKMYGWEMHFANLVDASRRKELKETRHIHSLKSISLYVLYFSQKVMLLIAVAVFVLHAGGDLTPDIVFICIFLLSCLQYPSFQHFTRAISMGAETMITFERIQKFLLLKEQSKNLNLYISYQRPAFNMCEILMNGVKASWNDDEQATLHNITLAVKSGELLAVVGPVGSGKTTLLMTILGELLILSGKAEIRGRRSYASQDPWIFDGTIRQNIVCGSDFDNSKYNTILSVCALHQDISMFPDEDLTMLGEKGARISGGQKTRINLARAIYSDADIFLLDDPLSAVDSSVSKHIFDRCINGYLKNKIRVLVTHQLQFLKKASRILVMENGVCTALGTYQQLIEAGIQLESLVSNCKQEQCEQLLNTLPSSTTISITDEPMIEATQCNSNVSDAVEKLTKCFNPGFVPMYKENKISGSVDWNVYKKYVASGAGVIFICIVFFSHITAQAFANASDFWITHWTSLEQVKHNVRNCWSNLTKTLNDMGYYRITISPSTLGKILPNSNQECLNVTKNYTLDVNNVVVDINSQYQLCVYVGLVSILILFSVLRTTSFFKMCMRASETLHDKLFRSILKSPVSFFDSVPVGNILNRVSQDMGIIDEMFPASSIEMIEILLNLVGIVFVVGVVEPYMAVPTSVLGIICVYLRHRYLYTARDLKRYECITRSPMFSLINSSLNGLTTIRTLRLQQPFENLYNELQDRYTATYVTHLFGISCFLITIGILGNLYITIVIVAVILKVQDPSSAARAGLAIAVALQINKRIQLGLKRTMEFESQITSVERVLEYTNLKPEAALESEMHKHPSQNWPSRGYIMYKNVSMWYSPNESPVLKNLSFEIYPREKIGIVGRTGAGKSSLISSLFRLVEAEGLIMIDDVNIRDIGLHDLRKKLTIIPQSPTLFTGTIRKNLDPFGEHSDSELWKSLEEVFLKQSIQLLPGGLDAKLTERGSNFSVGQRQLVCLARAILRKNRIIVLDEATANVDLNTDRLIQHTIRNRFEHCTVLTIAHRLHTIMDADRVMVIESGEIKEFDEPYNLLQNPKSLLNYMVMMMGSVMARELRIIANATHLKKMCNSKFVTDINIKKLYMDTS